MQPQREKGGKLIAWIVYHLNSTLLKLKKWTYNAVFCFVRVLAGGRCFSWQFSFFNSHQKRLTFSQDYPFTIQPQRKKGGKLRAPVVYHLNSTLLKLKKWTYNNNFCFVRVLAGARCFSWQFSFFNSHQKRLTFSQDYPFTIQHPRERGVKLRASVIYHLNSTLLILKNELILTSVALPELWLGVDVFLDNFYSLILIKRDWHNHEITLHHTTSKREAREAYSLNHLPS